MMSKTKRRVNGDQSWKDWMLSDWRLDRDSPNLSHAEAVKKNTARYHSDGSWTMTTPGWWVRMMMTTPQRAKVRGLLREVMHMELDNLIDYPFFPLAKKPHCYYW
jgi:hypothetical protein